MHRIELLAPYLTFPKSNEPSPQEKAASVVINKFLDGFTKANRECVVETFWSDASFWGTSSQSLVTSRDGIQDYFQSFNKWAPYQRNALWGGGWATTLSATSVAISGLWTIASTPDGSTIVRLLRMSAVVSEIGGHWKIAQFHNSEMPGC